MSVMNRAALAACCGCALIASSSKAEIAWGVTQQQRLISFDTNAPLDVLSGFFIGGLAANEQLTGLDYRPSDGMLYGLGSMSNLYRVNPMNGQATLVSQLSMTLNGASFGTDFNPTGPVALRIVSNTDKNYRVTNPGTGGNVVQDTDLAYVSGDSRFGVNPSITHVAYTNNVPGSTSTVLYGIDAGQDTLVRFGSPNAGTLNTVGTLGMGMNADINAIGGFDISGLTGIAYAAIQNVSQFQSTLWKIDLNTGSAMSLGEVGGGETLVAFTVPAPGATGLALFGAIALGRRRR